VAAGAVDPKKTANGCAEPFFLEGHMGYSQATGTESHRRRNHRDAMPAFCHLRKPQREAHMARPRPQRDLRCKHEGRASAEDQEALKQLKDS
jgi:hypothetical protein